jgi:hypothetical protein
MTMAVIRIVCTDWTAQQLRAQALKENRTLSAMGAICLSESLENRRSTSAATERLVRVLKGTDADVAP